MAQAYLAYPVVSGDTLQYLAQRFLGDVTRWSELATLNHLRYPYISESEVDRLGRRLDSSALASAASAAQTTISLTSAPISLRVGSTLRLARRLGAGPVYDEVAATSVVTGGGITTVTLATPLASSYLAQQTVDIYAPQRDLIDTVMQPGDVLLIPNERAEVVLPRPDFLKGLGIDLDMTQSQIVGELHYLPEPSTATPQPMQDAATVLGVGAIRQAVYLRLNVGLEQMELHPDYGNALIREIGSKMSPYFILLGNGYIRDALRGDTRIAGVERVEIVIDGDSVLVDVDVLIQDTIQLLSLTNLVIGV